jgi:hypothetical protein
MTKQGKMPKDTNQRAKSIVDQATEGHEGSEIVRRAFPSFEPVPISMVRGVVRKQRTSPVDTVR